jgi:hypothetical protein
VFGLQRLGDNAHVLNHIVAMVAIIPIELIDILPVALQRLQCDTKEASEIYWRFTQ